MTSFQQQYLVIKQRYDSLQPISEISNLVTAGLTSSNDQSTITTYYSTITGINTDLQALMNTASTELMAPIPSANEQRYLEREYPDSTTATRELLDGVFPTMHPNTLPFILSGGIFMAALAIFMIFETLGFRGNVVVPPALTGMSTGPVPFYKNSLVLGGLSVVLLIATITYATKYYTKQ